ncbi:HNH endonuclease family protein [Veillonella sp. CHU740]|uniref:HNH endonuclease family protein n=1 Tax=Veillonella sp. CHU740 TaxID=2490950 RepID=UPI00210F8A3D|nr:HNH endonuclease family protein [Veillonella sp. CHU740]
MARQYNNGYFSKSRPDTLDLYTSKQTPRSMYKWTIEHILPDGRLNSDWIQSLSKGNKQVAEEIQEKYKNKLGNLTLTPYNSEMSNSSFIVKRDYNPSGSEYEGLRSGLFLNESIVDSVRDEDISNKEEWTAEDINRRTDILSDLIIDLYTL